ncbi:MAG: carbohydrate ABC transporter permease [Caldilineaceae bacterium]
MLFLALMPTLMVPYQVTLIPTFILFSKLGWVGTHLPLWVPAFWGGAFGTFLMRQFFMTIPIDLAESARMDGANIGRIFRHIYVPLAKPALATLAIFTFMWSWNDLLNPAHLRPRTGPAHPHRGAELLPKPVRRQVDLDDGGNGGQHSAHSAGRLLLRARSTSSRGSRWRGSSGESGRRGHRPMRASAVVTEPLRRARLGLGRLHFTVAQRGVCHQTVQQGASPLIVHGAVERSLVGL